MLADHRYCYPLTITDLCEPLSDALLRDALETTKEMYAFTVFERAFKDFGLPLSIRSDNGGALCQRECFRSAYPNSPCGGCA